MNYRKIISCLFLWVFAFYSGCSSDPVKSADEETETSDNGLETVSLLGRELIRPTLDEVNLRKNLSNLEEAEKNLASNPNDPNALVWLGRRTAYLGKYREAISIFSQGIDKYPDNPEFYRHRGHRYISLRKFDQAIEDLEKASILIQGQPDRIEPDGIPNSRNTPTSTLQSNIWYHLGLAYYLKGDFKSATRCYRECIKVSKNDDMLVATSHWLYMSLRRSNDPEGAEEALLPIHPEMDIIENSSYFELLLMYKGLKGVEEFLSSEDGTPESAATSYGIGNWYLYNGNMDIAKSHFRTMVEGPGWAGFGFIAAEAELARNP